MKKILTSILGLLLLPSLAFAQFTVKQGGIGTSSVPANYVVIGSSDLHLTAAATSSLGLESPVTFNSPLSRVGNAVSFLFNTVNTWTARNIFSNASTSLETISGSLWLPTTSALLLTSSGGLVSGYAGTSCTNQFVRSLSVLGAATCQSVANTDLTNSSVTYNGITVALGASGTLTAASSSLLSDTNTFSTTATTTFSGNMKISGNLQVLGTFYAPVQIVSSGNATINGNLTVTGTTNLTGLLTMVNASSTNLTASQSFYAANNAAVSRRVTGVHALSFTLASTTVWTGTSSATTAFGDGGTVYAPFTGATESLQCGTNTGGLSVSVSSGGSSIFLIASSTAGVNPKVLSFTSGAAITIQGGTPTASPTSTACTLITHEN